MNGIWLLLWIIWVFFAFGVGVGRWLEHRRKTPHRTKVKLDVQAFLNPLPVIVSVVIFNTVEHVVKAGWIPKTESMRHFLDIGVLVLGIYAFAYLTLAIIYIIKNRMGERQKCSAAHSELL